MNLDTGANNNNNYLQSTESPTATVAAQTLSNHSAILSKAGSFGKRNATWSALKSADTVWDMLVIGGGITGAGVAREAAKRGLKVLLIEQADFSWGTSSRSSKMVHGGLRYISQGEFALTRESVVERQRLLDEAPGLVDPMKYLFTFKKGSFPPKFLFNIVLRIYDYFAGRRDYVTFGAEKTLARVPQLSADNLYGGTEYTDAVTDDSRLVLRVLHEAVADGAQLINYVKASSLLRDDNGQVIGVSVENQQNKQSCDIHAKVVVSATGVWADKMRAELVQDQRIRPLRGSHLVLPASRLPIDLALTFPHVDDGRFGFVYPWEGTTVIGTTDLDHAADLDIEAGITSEEVDYLLKGINAEFPEVALTTDDVITTWSGVRPIVFDEGVDVYKMKPSDASRNHTVWNNKGLITITGGKLTTFRSMAVEVLEQAQSSLDFELAADSRVFAPVAGKLNNADMLTAAQQRRLQGFYGNCAQQIIDDAKDNELEPIAESLTLWAELRWHCRYEAVEHLDDLMLRRTRLGLVLAEGGLPLIAKIGTIVQDELNWDDETWHKEVSRYADIWQSKYSLPSCQE